MSRCARHRALTLAPVNVRVRYLAAAKDEGASAVEALKPMQHRSAVIRYQSDGHLQPTRVGIDVTLA